MSGAAARDLLWRIAGAPAFRVSGHNWYGYRRLVLRLFGARVAPRSRFRRSVRIDRPWNLEAGALAMFGDHVVLRAHAPIAVGARCVVSQYAVLSTLRRDPPGPAPAPIIIEDDCWVATEALVLPGSHMRSGAVVGARSMVEGDVAAWTVVAGEPAVPIAPRMLSAPGARASRD